MKLPSKSESDSQTESSDNFPQYTEEPEQDRKKTGQIRYFL